MALPLTAQAYDFSPTPSLFSILISLQLHHHMWLLDPSFRINMSEAPQKEEPAQAPSAKVEHASDQAILAKRSAADDDVEFISSNPLRKRRLTEQKPAAQVAQASMPPPPIPQPQNPFTSQVAPVDRHRSLCDMRSAKGHDSEALLENRGTSLPVLESFVFPQSLPSTATQSSRLSEAISPKQLPHPCPAGSDANANLNQLPPPAQSPGPQNSVTLDQISCIDFKGVPTNTPGLDLSRIFYADGGVMSFESNIGPSAPASSLPNQLSTHNTIPFTMYSTGNIVAMPHMQGENHFPASFAGGPLQAQHQNHGASFAGHPPVHQGQYPASPRYPQAQAPGRNVASSSSPSPASGPKPPCPHCARIQQETLLRQTRGPPQLLGINAVQPQHQASQKSIRQSSSAPVPLSSHLPHLVPTQPRSSPRPTSAGGPPATTQGQQHQMCHAPSRLPAHPVASATPAPLSLDSGLLEDIAQTVKATFPFSQVAGRHGLAVGQVFDLVSQMLKRPLMDGVCRPPGKG